jgi:signal transduction histidine kinase
VETPESDAEREAEALAAAALVLVGEGATAQDLATRSASLHHVQQPAVAATLLERLARRGLVRVGTGHAEHTRYVRTVLGQQYAEATFVGSGGLGPRLEELEHLRSDMIVTISHELRTPLTAVRTAIGLLLDPNLPPDEATRARLLETIAASADRMQRLVTDVLDLSRFRSGGVSLQRRRFDASALARASAAAMEPLVKSRGQRVDVSLPPQPAWVYADRRRLEQVLLNLLSNAHMFSGDGEPVHLSVSVDGADVLWRVADHGVGIPPEDRPRLFERFFSAPTDAAGLHAGTGLGLPLALAIANAHGGSIEVESEPGQGSVFTLRVPAQGPPDEEDEE